MSSTILFNQLYPYLAAFAEGGTYTRTRRGKREIVRKGRRKRIKKGQVLKKAALVTGGGILAGGAATGSIIGKGVSELYRGKQGIVFKTLMSRGGGLKVLAIPIAAAGAGGYATYRLAKKRMKQK